MLLALAVRSAKALRDLRAQLQVKATLGVTALHREVVETDTGNVLREPQRPYMAHSGTENIALFPPWRTLIDVSRWSNDKEPAVRLVLSLTFGPQGLLFRYTVYHSAR